MNVWNSRISIFKLTVCKGNINVTVRANFPAKFSHRAIDGKALGIQTRPTELWISGGKYKAQKDGNIGVHGEDVAYEIVDFWAQEQAKKLNIPYYCTPKKDLDKRLKGEFVPTTPSKLYNPLIAAFSNKGVFKGVVTSAFKAEGYERVKQVLESALEALELINNKDKVEQEKTSEAKDIMAKSMLEIFEKTGVDMQASISDPDVLKIYKELKAKAKEWVKNEQLTLWRGSFF